MNFTVYYRGHVIQDGLQAADLKAANKLCRRLWQSTGNGTLVCCPEEAPAEEHRAASAKSRELNLPTT